jgi:hypothetical protein
LRLGFLTAADPKVYRTPPDPSPDWPTWRQDRLRVAIRAALLFLEGKEWTEILRVLEKAGLLEKERVSRREAPVSKARIQQYVSRGCNFLLDRGCFVEVPGTNP